MISEPTLQSYDELFIGGRWVRPSGDEVIEVVSPVTELPLATVASATTADVDLAVSAARRAFDSGPWPRMRPAERAAHLARVRDEINSRLDLMCTTFTAEIGAPQPVSRGFHEGAVKMWEQAIELLDTFEFEEQREWSEGSGRVIFEPVGVVAAIVPWNGPVGAATLKIAPALAAGCTVVVKPAPEGPISMMILAEALDAAGLPEGVISIVPGDRNIGEHLVNNPDVDKVTFTGGTEAGKKIMSTCGERIARVTLELGGKSAAIIADDIELEAVLPSLTLSGIRHSGQVCSSLTRILVPRHRQEELLAVLGPAFDQLSVGDPADPETVLGPLVSERQRDRVESYIEVGIAEGARLVTGGGRPAGCESGWFIEPTLFADVTNDMRIAREEIFGPVVCVIPFDSVDEAVEIANDSPYGLAGAVYARDSALAEQVARRIRTGQISINSAKTSALQPFGGFKQSGIGREGNVEGLTPYLESKLILNP